MKTMTSMFLAAVTLAACAKSPSAIPPVSMAGAYDNMSCTQVKAALSAEQSNLAALSSAQNAAVAGDAVGVLLIAVPVSSLTGGDKAGEIGLSKGKVAAYEAKLASC